MVLTLPSLLDQFARCWTRKPDKRDIAEMILYILRVMVHEKVVIVSKELQVPYVVRKKFWDGFLKEYGRDGDGDREGDDVVGLFAKVGLRGC